MGETCQAAKNCHCGQRSGRGARGGIAGGAASRRTTGGHGTAPFPSRSATRAHVQSLAGQCRVPRRDPVDQGAVRREVRCRPGRHRPGNGLRRTGGSGGGRCQRRPPQRGAVRNCREIQPRRSASSLNCSLIPTAGPSAAGRGRCDPADLQDVVEGVFGLDDRPQAAPHFRRLAESAGVRPGSPSIRRHSPRTRSASCTTSRRTSPVTANASRSSNSAAAPGPRTSRRTSRSWASTRQPKVVSVLVDHAHNRPDGPERRRRRGDAGHRSGRCGGPGGADRRVFRPEHRPGLPGCGDDRGPRHHQPPVGHLHQLGRSGGRLDRRRPCRRWTRPSRRPRPWGSPSTARRGTTAPTTSPPARTGSQATTSISRRPARTSSAAAAPGSPCRATS